MIVFLFLSSFFSSICQSIKRNKKTFFAYFYVFQLNDIFQSFALRLNFVPFRIKFQLIFQFNIISIEFRFHFKNIKYFKWLEIPESY